MLQLTDNELPVNSIEVTNPRLALGLSNFRSLSRGFGLSVEATIEATFDGRRNTLVKTDQFSLTPRLGVEVDYKKFAFLRLGVTNFQQDVDIDRNPFWTADPSIGVGVKIKDFTLDYAFTDIGERRNNTFSHVISLMYNLPAKPVKTGF